MKPDSMSADVISALILAEMVNSSHASVQTLTQDVPVDYDSTNLWA